VESNVRLSKVNLDDDRIFVGSQTGKIYTIDWSENSEMEAKLIAKLPYSGETQLNFSTKETYPIPPVVAHQPILAGENGLVVASAQDGRLYFMKRSGEFEKIVQTDYVRELFDFSQMTLDQQNFIVATSISYINVYLPTGEKVATYSNAGAENFYTPLWMSGNSYAAGMYKGVFQFKMKRLEGTYSSESMKLCE
jgi:outer membrane protein assembly factor BamB